MIDKAQLSGRSLLPRPRSHPGRGCFVLASVHTLAQQARLMSERLSAASPSGSWISLLGRSSYPARSCLEPSEPFTTPCV